MNFPANLRRIISDLLTAVQFLTRIPVPEQPYASDSLARSAKFFPLVGLVIGGIAAGIGQAITPHLPRLIVAFVLLTFLLGITGALHEDGLSDAADGFGGGTTREKTLLIMRDSRIGTYGGAAITLSLVGRLLLIAALRPEQLAPYLIAAHVLCRWTTLPLSHFLAPARINDSTERAGQGARLAKLTSKSTLIVGTGFSIIIVVLLLHGRAIAPLLCALAISLFTGLYYRSRIGGVTGDCFGATNQLTEIGVYLCGVWLA